VSLRAVRGQERAAFRFDTRIYLCGCKDHREEDGECVGVFVGLNPGSADVLNPSDVGKWAEFEPDQTLKLVRKCFVEAAGEDVRQHAYVQVWNLFYARGPKSQTARRLAGAFPELRRCCSEKTVRPKLVWYAWSGNEAFWTERERKERKDEFRGLGPDACFYIGNSTGAARAIIGKPGVQSFVGHPRRKRGVETAIGNAIRLLLNPANPRIA